MGGVVSRVRSTPAALVAAAVLVVSGGVAASAASANAGTGAAAVQVGRVEAHPWQKVAVWGSGFRSGATVALTFAHTTIGHAPVGGNGRFKVSVEVPGWAKPGPHQVQATDGVGDQASTPLVVGTNWDMDGFRSDRAGLNPYENVLNRANVAQLNQVWAYSDQLAAANGGTAEAEPAVVDGVAYFCIDFNQDFHGALFAVDASTGAFLWHTGAACTDTPLVMDGTIYSINDAVFTAFDTSGEELWSSEQAVGTQIVADDNGIVYTSGPAAIDLATRQVLWNASGEYRISSSSFAYGSGIMAFATQDGQVEAVDPANGNLLWSFNTVYPTGTTPTIADGVVYAADANHVYALNASDGSLIWQNSTINRPGIGSPVVGDGKLYVVTYSGTYALDPATGNVLWENTDAAGVSTYGSYATLANGVLYTADDNGPTAIDENTGQTLWATAGQGSPGGVIVVNGNMYFTAGSGMYDYTIPGKGRPRRIT